MSLYLFVVFPKSHFKETIGVDFIAKWPPKCYFGKLVSSLYDEGNKWLH